MRDVNKSASALNPDKLLWLEPAAPDAAAALRGRAELRWQLERLGIAAQDDAKLEAIVLAQRERAKTLKEMAETSRFFFELPVSYEEKAARKNLTPETAPVLEQARIALGKLTDWRRPPSTPRSRAWPRRAVSGSARSRSRCGWPCPAAPYRRRSTRRWRSWVGNKVCCVWPSDSSSRANDAREISRESPSCPSGLVVNGAALCRLAAGTCPVEFACLERLTTPVDRRSPIHAVAVQRRRSRPAQPSRQASQAAHWRVQDSSERPQNSVVKH